MGQVLERKRFIFTLRFDVACDQAYIPHLRVSWLWWSLVEGAFEESGDQWVLTHVTPIHLIMNG